MRQDASSATSVVLLSDSKIDMWLGDDGDYSGKTTMAKRIIRTQHNPGETPRGGTDEDQSFSHI